MYSEGGKQIWLSFNPFFDTALADMTITERYLINNQPAKHKYMVMQIGKESTRKFYKEKQLAQAEREYRRLVKKEFGIDLEPLCDNKGNLRIGKVKIKNGKVEKAKRIKKKK